MPAMDYAKVADLYDIYARTEIDVPFFLREAQGCCSALELTSGTGRLSLPLIEAGAPLSCLDSSPEMLAKLRQKLQAKGLSAPIYEMDVCDFSIPGPFDLIIFPFNAFAEITSAEGQKAALSAIRAHLADDGRFICTLHNPAVRLKQADGEIRLRGRFPLPQDQETLFLSACERYDPAAHLVSGAQFYEIYAPEGVLEAKRFVDIQFFVHSRESFEGLALSLGFQIDALYGDYGRGEFDPEKSPFMIWILSKLA